jgi:hypothetical protein
MNRQQTLNNLIAQNIVTFIPRVAPGYEGDGEYFVDGLPFFTSYYYRGHLSLTQAGRVYWETETSGGGYCTIEFVLTLLTDRTRTPNLFFKNGKVRIEELRELNKRLNDRDLKHFPFTLKCVAQIEEKWSTLSLEVQQRISRIAPFSAEGVCTSHWENVTLLGEGQVRIPRSEMLPVAPFLNSRHMWQRLPKTSKRFSVTYNEYTQELTPAEYALFLSSFVKCTVCGAWERNNFVVFGLCSSCSSSSPKELCGYSERATSTLSFKSEKSKYSSRFLGVELEYERTDKYTQAESLFLLHRNLKGHAIFKRDGSLSNGIEICTRPASAIVHVNEVKKMFEDEECMSSIQVKESCGMHVHIDRTKMGSLTLGKLLKFMQADENKSFLGLVAGREANHFARLGTNDPISAFHRGNYRERYRGINLQNSSTAEVRIFRTPDTFDKFLTNIEFITALTDYVEPANSGVNELSYKHFTKFVQGNSSSYKQLHKVMKGFV